MKRVLPYKELSEREVPEALDFRILNHARSRTGTRKKFRRWCWIGGVAAALCLTAFTGVFFEMQQRYSAEHKELLAMGDFSRLDQSGYNISFELASTGDFSQY